jgi:hypothetical protein
MWLGTVQVGSKGSAHGRREQLGSGLGVEALGARMNCFEGLFEQRAEGEGFDAGELSLSENSQKWLNGSCGCD